MVKSLEEEEPAVAMSPGDTTDTVVAGANRPSSITEVGMGAGRLAANLVRAAHLRRHGFLDQYFDTGVMTRP